MMLEHVLVLSAYLFSVGLYGLITSRNMPFFSIFVIAIAAAEAAIGLAIVSSIYRNRKSTRINQSNLLNK
ncbi:putative NADH dehydrogenase (quinone) [Helianthus debilis subsp. tardiflorus]